VSRSASFLAVPAGRIPALAALLERLEAARRIVLTTHVNADGDAAGSEVAVAAWLATRGKDVRIINPTPFPEAFRYLVDDPALVLDHGQPGTDPFLAGADLVFILDTSEPGRIGRLARRLEGRHVAILDHHPPGATTLSGTALQDPSACATGELVYDLLCHAGLAEPWPRAVIEGLYAAIVTDTGSFRFANTTPRTHAIAGDLLRRGVDPEAAYRRLFATMPFRRIQLLRTALDSLEVDPEFHLSWMTIRAAEMADAGTTAEDLDGVVEYARSIEGTEIAILFRETADRATKISFRSNGEADVSAIARQFGGGGHVKAAGALVGGEPLPTVRERVLDAARNHLRELELHDRKS
jgi:phosphoesterase RecJ-like protein